MKIEDLIAAIGESDVEAVARAVCRSEGVDPDAFHYEDAVRTGSNTFRMSSGPEWTYRREEARKLIALWNGAARYLATLEPTP